MEEFVNLLDEIEYERERTRKMSNNNNEAKSKISVERNKSGANNTNKDCEISRETAVNAQRKFGLRETNYRRDNVNLNNSGTQNNDERRANDYNRDSANMNRFVPVRNYRDNNTENVKEKLTLVEIPDNANEIQNKEIVLYRPNANAKAKARGKTNDKKFPPRKSVTVIENETKQEKEETDGESEEEEPGKKIIIIRTREIIRDVDEVLKRIRIN